MRRVWLFEKLASRLSRTVHRQRGKKDNADAPGVSLPLHFRKLCIICINISNYIYYTMRNARWQSVCWNCHGIKAILQKNHRTVVYTSDGAATTVSHTRAHAFEQ